VLFGPAMGVNLCASSLFRDSNINPKSRHSRTGPFDKPSPAARHLIVASSLLAHPNGLSVPRLGPVWLQIVAELLASGSTYEPNACVGTRTDGSKDALQELYVSLATTGATYQTGCSVTGPSACPFTDGRARVTTKTSQGAVPLNPRGD
jgi:hypothetical protein